MKKKILLVILALFFLIVMGILYINIFILPTKAKAFIINRFEGRLGFGLEIEKLRYIPPATLWLNNITLYRDTYYANELLKIENIKFNLALLPFLRQKNFISKLELRNLSARNIKLNGSVLTSLTPNPSSPLKVDGTVRLVGFSLKPSFLQDGIDRFNGVINLEKNGIFLKDAGFYFRNRNYKLDGNLNDLKEPILTFALNSDELSSHGKFLIKDGYIQIEKLKTQLRNSTFDLIGDISELSRPLVNLYGESRIDISDMAIIFPIKNKDFVPQGIVDVALFLKGKLDQLQNIELGFKIKSDKISVQDFTFNNLYMDLRMQDGLITTPKILAEVYDGLLSGTITLEPFDRNRPYSIDLSLQNANLAKWAQKTKLNKRISGTLSSRLLLNGYNHKLNTLNGNGWISITDGHLWEIPILGGLADILGIVNLKSVVFKEAAGNFEIGNKRVNISDLILYSDEVNLSVKGNIDFNGTLDLAITTNVAKDLMKDSSDVAKIANVLMQQAGQFLGRVKVTGTLKNPEYNFRAKPAEVIKPIEKVLKKEIGDVLKDILE